MEIKRQAQQVFEQISCLLEKLDNSRYHQSLKILNGSTLGQHIRHIYCFYKCLIDGVETGIVNYDKRVRDTLIETNVFHSKIALESIDSKIQRLDVSQQLIIISNKTIDPPYSDGLKSSAGRELLYATDHSIHHLALLKIGVSSCFPEIEVEENMGVAPSTIEYKNTCAQ